MMRTDTRGRGDCIRCEEVPVCIAAWFSPGNEEEKEIKNGKLGFSVIQIIVVYK